MKMSKKNPLVFLDVSIDGDPAERMIFELFSNAAPKTVENFRSLCTGERGNSPKTGRPLHYKGSFFHHIAKGLMAQGGDFLKRDGNFGESIYGEKFPDEPHSKLKHDERGLLTMAVADQDMRGSFFSVTFKPNHHLDRKHMVFGKLVRGYDVLDKIENVGDEDGRASVMVKIINCGEFSEEKKRAKKLTSGKDGSSRANSREVNRKGKHQKSSRERRKRRRRRYYTSESEMSESETTLDSMTESSDSDSESSYLSSSSDDKRKKRKRSSKRDRYRHGKKSKRHEKKHWRLSRKTKHRSKRAYDSLTDTDSQSESSDDSDADVERINQINNTQTEITARHHSPLPEGASASVPQNEGNAIDVFEKEVACPRENGDRQSNGVELKAKAGTTTDRPEDIVVDHPGKSRSRSISPRRSLSKSISVSPRKSLSPRRSFRSPSVDESPERISRGKIQVTGKKERSISRSPTRSPITTPRWSHSRSPPRTSSKRSSQKVSRSPMRDVERSLSRSPVRSFRVSASRSSGKASPFRRSISRSPVRMATRSVRRSYSRSPLSDRGKSLSRSPSRGGSPKRIRRGRGFSQRFSYARRYRTPSPDRSPVRSYRYGRSDHDRRSPRRYRSPPRERVPIRRSPRRYRSPPRTRTPVRYRRRRSRTRSPLSRSPARYRPKDRSPPSGSRSSSVSRSPPHLQSPERVKSEVGSGSRSRSRSGSGSSSRSPPGNNNKGLVSYGDGSADSGQR